jgi:hypothetical protein
MQVLKEPEIDVERLEYLVFDIDDTLGPWCSPQAKGLNALVRSLVSRTILTRGQVVESIKSLFESAGTMDYGYLLQNMDVLVDELVNFSSDSTIAMRRGIIVTQMARSAYEYARDKCSAALLLEAQLFLHDFRKRTEEIFAVTDAPLFQAKRRLVRRAMVDYFKQVFGQREPSARQNKKFRFLPGMKPNIDLSTVLKIDASELQERGVVIGNSFVSDVGLAANNGMMAIQTPFHPMTREEGRLLNAVQPESLRKLHSRKLSEVARMAVIGATRGCVVAENWDEVRELLGV